jgi:phosphoglycolate phosphatase
VIVFDLDGTLVDTVVDIAASMNHALVTHGARALPIVTYRRIVGEGVHRLAERALEEQGATGDADALVDAFRPHYAAHLLDATAPYPGIPALLDALVARGTPLAVLSNKPDAPTKAVVRALFPAIPFVAVYGERPGIPRKPDPTALREILGDRDPARCALVGDTLIDVGTARAAGVRAIAVAWGFRPAAELASADRVLLAPADLLDER